MAGLMGSTRIIKKRIQRNNTDPLGCAAAPFSGTIGRFVLQLSLLRATLMGLRCAQRVGKVINVTIERGLNCCG